MLRAKNIPQTIPLLSLGLLFPAASLSAGETAQPGAPASVPLLNEQSFRQWIDFIRPNESELKWRKIGWRTELWEAVLEARELQQPLLLWTMNGHPMACT